MTGPFSSLFGLSDNPFRANPDPRYLFLTQRTQESLDQLIEGIRARKGLMLLTGEVGTGKTVLLNRLMEWLDHERIPKAFIFNSHLKVSELFDLILKDLGIPFAAQHGTPFTHFTNWLQDRHRAGETAVLIVDEAQGLALNVIEELCMLLNLQSVDGSLLQIILCGQPEFEEMLQRPGLRQMRQRVALRCRTLPLTLEEARSYISYRLRVAGASDSDAAVFHPEALQALFLYSGGIPRVLNLLCEQALMRASRDHLRPVPGNTVGEVAHQFELDGGRPLSPHFTADGAGILELFAPRPVIGEARGRITASASFRDSAQLAAHSADILKSRASQPEASNAVREPVAQRGADAPGGSSVGDVPAMPRASHATIRFPLPVQAQPPAAMELREVSGSSCEMGSPVDALVAELVAVSRLVTRGANEQAQGPQQQSVSRRHWERHHFSVANRAKSEIAAMSAQARILLARAATHIHSSFQDAGKRWTGLRTRIGHVRINVAWPDFATSCLQWLRATATPAVQQRVSTAVSHSAVAHPARSARRPAASQSSRRRLQNIATRPQPRRNLENTRRLTTSVLRWLQQPSRSMRGRSTAASSTTRMA